jgi:hypothetical protein
VEPLPALILELDRNAACGVLRIADLGDRVDERAAAESRGLEDALQPVERAQDRCLRRLELTPLFARTLILLQYGLVNHERR